MDLIKVIFVVLRRWYVVVPILLMGTAASFVTARAIPPEFSASGVMVVVDTTSSGGVSASALAESVQDGDTAAEVTAGGAATYRVEATGDGILRVQADAQLQKEAIRVGNEVLELLQPTADALAPGTTVEVLNRPASAISGPAGFRATGAARLIGGGSEGGFSGRAASNLLSQLLADGAVYANAVVGETEYEVSTSRELPTVTVQATGTSEQDVLATIRNVFGVSNGTLDQVAQVAGFSAAAVEARPLSEPAAADEETKGIFRSLVALLALTVALAVGVALVLEAWVQREVKRRPHRLADVSSTRTPAPDDRLADDRPSGKPAGSQADNRYA